MTVESLARRASIESDSDEAVVAERLMARQRAASREHAVFLADLARLWVERDDPEVRDDREEMDLVAAIALRTTTSFAGSQLRDAHLALTDLPRTYAQLAAGVMPVEWFTRLVVAVRALTQVQRDQVDQRVATWQLASIPAESFRRHLKTLIAWFTAEQKPTCPQELRDVTFEPSPAEDGTACVRLTGPIPELVSFTRRLDQWCRTSSATPWPRGPRCLSISMGRPRPTGDHCRWRRCGMRS